MTIRAGDPKRSVNAGLDDEASLLRAPSWFGAPRAPSTPRSKWRQRGDSSPIIGTPKAVGRRQRKSPNHGVSVPDSMREQKISQSRGLCAREYMNEYERVAAAALQGAFGIDQTGSANCGTCPQTFGQQSNVVALNTRAGKPTGSAPH